MKKYEEFYAECFQSTIDLCSILTEFHANSKQILYSDIEVNLKVESLKNLKSKIDERLLTHFQLLMN